eukprot:TRINITY_DN63583_c0_g1_i1.p1 TRINITY_DN63583_c0_g1~~TRINITY_DN63583_c0_g1_i1.p1  ORF type:complete len:302 (+),score=58.71 TRINITY_DN63583_c0_g1_i1:67-972(+)
MSFPDNTPLCEWMGKLPEAVRRRKSICELALPFCHNAGAQKVKDVPLRTLEGFVGKMVAQLPLAKTIATPICSVSAVCQRQSIDELLRMGVRGLDLRVGMHAGEIHICHNVVCDLTLARALQQVADFLRQRPSEVVVVLIKRDWDSRDFDTRENWATLQATTESLLGDMLLCRDADLKLPLQELCAQGKRAAVIIQTHFELSLGIKACNSCLESSWADSTRSVDAMLSVMQEWRSGGRIEPQPGKLKLMEVALPIMPSHYAPRALEAFRGFLETAPFNVAANLDFPDEVTIKAIIRHNWTE